jgi:tRNA(Ile)-lysidine synthase TilS/MesJ
MIEFKPKKPLPINIFLGFSGGVDSVACLEFLNKKHNVTLVYLNHRDPIAEEEEAAVDLIADEYNLKLIKFRSRVVPKKNKEHVWRGERYHVFHNLNGPVITCHHLDDCVETWVWKSLTGVPSVIPYAHKNVIRPFRTTRKYDFEALVKRKGLFYFQDPTNQLPEYATRNYIRNVVMPHVLKINPGIHTTIRKKVLQEE